MYTEGGYEMDRSRFKRPETNKQRQTNTTTFGISASVPKVDYSRAHTGRPVRPRRNMEGFVAPAKSVKAVPRPGALAVQKTVEAAPKSVFARQLPIDMDLPAIEGKSRAARRKQWRKMRRMATRSAAVGLVLLITLSGLLFSQSYLKMHKVFKGSAGTAAALKTNVKPDLLKGEGSGRVNILLLGRGGGTHDAPDLTDTIMIASIDPVNKTADLVSIPRDLWVNVSNQGVMKINAAWQSGEFQALGKHQTGSTDPKAIKAGYNTIDSTIKDVTGLNINYHVLVDFEGFRQAIDTVGGVTVNVPADLVDPTMAWENHNDPVLARAGIQQMDGVKALLYARSRETSSDFARSERQRAILIALKSQVMTLSTLSNPVKLSKLISAFGNSVQSDLSISNVNRLYAIMKGVDNTKINSVSLVDAANPLVTTGNINGQSVVIPKAGLYKYGDIQTYLRTKLQDPYIQKEKAKILVLNGSSAPGLAATKADELKTYGYNVIGTGNTPTQTWTKTTLIDLTHTKKYTKNYLEQRFGQYAANSLGDTSIPTQGADFVIILGSDETASTQTQAR